MPSVIEVRLVPFRSLLLATCAFSALACSGASEQPSAADPGSLEHCVITIGPGASLATGDYAATGRVVTAQYVYEIDEVARTIAVSGNEPNGVVWYWTNTYDAIGQLVRHEHRDGTLGESTNTYDEARLTTTILSTGSDPITVQYYYDDVDNPELWTRRLSIGTAAQVVIGTTTRVVESGRITRSEFFYANEAAPATAWSFGYASDRLETMDRDWTFTTRPDGTTDVRHSWSRDGQGRITSYEQDGTDHADDPHIDGVADFRETYSPGCGELLERFPWLAHLPDPDEDGPVLGAPQIFRPGTPR